MAGSNMPTRVMMFRDFVPDKVRVFLCLFFAVAFQFSGGIYLSSVSQMVGSLALMQEDVMMAGYASFVGMTIIFPILFRLKFRFTTRSILLFVCPALIVCNLITMHTESLPVLVIVCFFAGMLRMWGTFEALSNVQLSLTPTRNFAVFFPVVYMIVLGSIQLSGLLTVYLGYWSNWHSMHWFIMGLLFVLWGLTAALTRHFRFMKPLPLFGIDWLGGALWFIFLLSVIFVFEYGKFYDWFDSLQILLGTLIAILSLALSIHRDCPPASVHRPGSLQVPQPHVLALPVPDALLLSGGPDRPAKHLHTRHPAIRRVERCLAELVEPGRHGVGMHLCLPVARPPARRIQSTRLFRICPDCGLPVFHVLSHRPEHEHRMALRPYPAARSRLHHSVHLAHGVRHRYRPLPAFLPSIVHSGLHPYRIRFRTGRRHL